MLNFLDTENNIYTKCKAITKIWANNSVFVCYWTIILHTSLWQKSIVKYSIIKYRHLDMRCIWQFFNKSLFSKLITDTHSSRNLDLQDYSVKMIIYWSVASWSLVENYWWFPGTYFLHLQGRRASPEASRDYSGCCLFFGLLFDTEDSGRTFLLNVSKPLLQGNTFHIHSPAFITSQLGNLQVSVVERTLLLSMTCKCCHEPGLC
jgi:hypothetical protein